MKGVTSKHITLIVVHASMQLMHPNEGVLFIHVQYTTMYMTFYT